VDAVWQLVGLYLRLGGGVGAGWLLGAWLPRTTGDRLGRFLFTLGVPLGIVAFLRGADLSGPVWIAPLAAWAAIAGGALLAWVWANWRLGGNWRERRAERGSLLLAAMFGNTGYIGYPVVLTLVGDRCFGWAVFYDVLGTTIGAYGLGVFAAAALGDRALPLREQLLAVVRNPPLWGFATGMGLRTVALPEAVDRGLLAAGWTAIAMTLVLLGMRLRELESGQQVRDALGSVAIKLLLVPLLAGGAFAALGLSGPPLLVVVLMMGMPPAFATLVLAEAYELARETTVTALALGTGGLALTLPVWLLLFGPAP